MIDDIIIPPEALLAARQAFVNAGTADDDRDPFAEACLAMLKNWPGMLMEWNTRARGKSEEIILPLPKEKPNE